MVSVACYSVSNSSQPDLLYSCLVFCPIVAQLRSSFHMDWRLWDMHGNDTRSKTYFLSCCLQSLILFDSHILLSPSANTEPNDFTVTKANSANSIAHTCPSSLSILHRESQPFVYYTFLFYLYLYSDKSPLDTSKNWSGTCVNDCQEGEYPPALHDDLEACCRRHYTWAGAYDTCMGKFFVLACQFGQC